MSATVSPAPGFVIHATEFERVLGPDPRIVEVIATDAHEGPVYAADEDAPTSPPSCEQGSFLEPAAITRLDRRTGAIETLVGGAGGLPLNSPSDVVVTRDGAVWFTDPSYGFLQGFRPQPPRLRGRHARASRRARGRRRRPRLRLGAQRDPRVLAQRRADRGDRAPGSRQLHVRRGRRNVLFVTADTAIRAVLLRPM